MRIPAVALIAAFCAPAAVAGEWTLEEFLKTEGGGGWEGFPVGTSIVTEEVKLSQGMEPQKTLKTSTLIRVTKAAFIVREEFNGTSTEINVARTDMQQAEIADAGEDTVTVGGEKFACKKKTITRPQKAKLKGSETMTVWIHDDHGLLRVDMEGVSRTASALSVKRKVGDLEFPCRVFEMSGDVKGMMVISMEVAGHAVERVIDMGGMAKIEFRLKEYTRGTGKAPPETAKPALIKPEVLTKQEIETYIELQKARKSDVKAIAENLKAKGLDVAAYGKLVGKVMTAYLALKRGDDGSQRAKIDEQIQDVKQRMPMAPGLTPDERRAALKQAVETLEAARELFSTKADIDAVRPFEDQLDELAEE